MTKANITQYDSTPSNNADINDINIAENCPASNINNAIRELMAHLKNVDTGSQALTALSVTGETTLASHINMGDGDIIKLGASADLQIQHDGSDSKITDSGAGNLILDSDGTEVRIMNGSEFMGRFQNNDAVKLFFDNSKKFETTSSGIDVTGGITADGEIDVASSSSTSTISATASGSANLVMGTNFSGSASQGMPNQVGFINMRQSFPIVFGTAETERMRITGAHGQVGINETNPGAMLHINSIDLANSFDAIRLKNQTDNSGGFFVRCLRSSSASIGGIRQSAQNALNFDTSSDYRLKENVTYDFDATSRLKKLKPCRFNWIDDNTNTLIDGFLAHEVSSLIPEATYGVKDELEVWKNNEELPEGVSVGDNKLDDDGNTIPKYNTIDHSKLVPLLTKALQEQQATIEALTARITALENA